MTQRQLIVLIIAVVSVAAWMLQQRDSESPSNPSLEFDRMTIGDYKPPFHDEWRRKHDVYPFDCWTDNGYDPSFSDIPRDIQLLSGMDYGKSDIDNGGFHQFFHNSTGVFAPEMVEWCERSGLDDVADVIRQAMSTLTDGDYPRSREGRHTALARFPVDGDREQWAPFYRLDEKFYALLSNNGSRYDDAADKWLRETCGITQLADPPKAEP
ncbi:DMP19 family protein [Roseiconus lacunae]|uniref:DUF4375 domain-containing protein n=1 Tax=Roseiconus lacunae TaxID=2605694 RepID=A0ABT7PSS2_9BACT|nr:DUF4375 domain-containing protein [Roseiconus lacunae]MDM4019539.1 DUF4375 domain-containing protein [Roseiconus lacunae]